ncbi:MAG: SBBP repeat-containing protein, partial [Candidatus Euphemobacter frigidus]|nr:SBBP repeat-containing protein [Candidatus Euphemobacter frigidus]
SGSGLVYSTYLGGSGVDFGGKIALDRDNHIYIAGTTWSENFPTRNCYSPSKTGKYDAFIGKFSFSGSDLIYSTYLGGGGFDFGNDIAVNKAGTAYITGFTLGEGFPELKPLYKRRDEDGTVFLTRLSSSGSSILFSTCWGTPGGEEGMVVALDSAGCVYVSGITGSPDFPLRNPFQPKKSGRQDIFMVKMTSLGSDIIYSTYLGGLDYERPFGLTVNSAGRANLAGCTYSYNFPVKSAYQPTMAGGSAGFVTGFSSSGSNLLFSTYLGGGNE